MFLLIFVSLAGLIFQPARSFHGLIWENILRSSENICDENIFRSGATQPNCKEPKGTVSSHGRELTNVFLSSLRNSHHIGYITEIQKSQWSGGLDALSQYQVVRNSTSINYNSFFPSVLQYYCDILNNDYCGILHDDYCGILRNLVLKRSYNLLSPGDWSHSSELILRCTIPEMMLEWWWSKWSVVGIIYRNMASRFT